MAHFSMAHSRMPQFWPVWRCSSVSQFRRRVSMAHAFCLDNNLYINDLQTEHSDCVNVRCLFTYTVLIRSCFEG